MTNTTRCPRCNQFGNPRLDNYCRRCDREIFEDELVRLCGGSVKLFKAAMLEIKAATIATVKREDRSRLFNILKRRRPPNRRKDLVQAASPLESKDMFKEPENYALVKEVTSIER